jgi:hypothetical protein
MKNDSYYKPPKTTSVIAELRPSLKHHLIYTIDLDDEFIIDFGTDAKVYKITRKLDKK